MKGDITMNGVFVPASRADSYKDLWKSCGIHPAEVVATFANAVALFSSDEGLLLGKLFATGAEDDQSKVYGEGESNLIRELAEPKPKTLTQADHDRRYRGYDWLLAEGVIADPRSKAAHKAWTTTRLWQSEMLRGNFTHHVHVHYYVGGQKFTHSDKAVSLAHGRALGRKAARKLARDLGVGKLIHEVEVGPLSVIEPGPSAQNVEG
jgi:hypothetical protein